MNIIHAFSVNAWGICILFCRRPPLCTHSLVCVLSASLVSQCSFLIVCQLGTDWAGSKERNRSISTMTVNYNLSVSTSRPWTFFRLFFRWKGSVWKAVWMQYLVWLALFFLFSFIYRFALNDWQKVIFVSVVDFTNARMEWIPLDWMLGFFIAAVLARFWYLYNIIGFMDNIALLTSIYVRGTTERARQYRRNIIRHCQLSQVLVFRDLSMRCRKRFPTLDTVEAAGFMMPHEKANFDEIKYKYSRYFLPFAWTWALIYRARKEGLIEGDYYVTILSEEVRLFRTSLAWLCNYDWVPLPMIYPTIVCLAVHTYFLVCVIARQYVDGSQHEKDVVDMWFPFMTSIQFVLYMGWLKVGEALLNPWGEDDDDFETNVLIDRNLAMGLKIVDDGYGKTPELKKDDFWDDEWVPLYSEESAHEKRYRKTEGSLANMKLSSSVSQVRMVPLGGGASSASLNRKPGSVRERIVPVRPDEVEQQSALGSFLTRSASKISLHGGPRKNFSTPHNLDRIPSTKKHEENGIPMNDFDENHLKIAMEGLYTSSDKNDHAQNGVKPKKQD